MGFSDTICKTLNEHSDCGLCIYSQYIERKLECHACPATYLGALIVPKILRSVTQ